jgi:hypothetical protein
MKVSFERVSIESVAARVNTLRNRLRRAQAIGDAGLKRVIEEELAEVRAQYQQLGRVGDSIVDSALRGPDSPAHRAKRWLA